MPGKDVSVCKGEEHESLWAPGRDGYSQAPAGTRKEGPFPGWVGPDGRLPKHPEHGVFSLILEDCKIL